MAVAVGCSALPPLFFSNMMNNYLAEQIGRFLENDKPSDQEVMDAAKLLLQCDPIRSRGIYNSAMVRPRSMLPWIRSDLKKFYDIHQKGLKSKDEVFLFNTETVTLIRETLSQRPVDVSEEELPFVPVTGIRGKRPDHDALPESIQECWNRNSERWKKIRQLHAQLSQMIARPGYQSCDGNELCHLLRQADKELRKDYKRYDTFVLTPSAKGQEKKDSVDSFTDNLKTIQNARTAITRALQRKSNTNEQLFALQQSVDTLLALRQKITEKTAARLKAIGIVIPDA